MSIANVGKKLAVMMVAAFAACMLSASVAFAATPITVTFNDLQIQDSNDEDVTYPYTTTVDADTLANTTTGPVLGQFCKNGWSVLATGHDVGDYATVQAILAAGLANYNTEHNVSLTLGDVLGANDNVQMQSNGAYTKYLLTYDDVMGTSNRYFYDLLAGTTGSFTSAGRSNTWNMVYTYTDENDVEQTITAAVSNPVSYRAVLAMKYGKATSATDTCASLAANAYYNEGNDAIYQPRVIIPGADNGSVAGNRFCSQVDGFVVQ